MGTRVAQRVHWLMDQGIIEDYSQCAILLKSTRTRAKIPAEIVDELRRLAIPVYNPANSEALASATVAIAMGALLEILDPANPELPTFQESIAGFDELHDLLNNWRQAYRAAIAGGEGRQLADYVERANEAIAETKPGRRCTTNLEMLFAHIVNLRPICEVLDEQDDQVEARNLASMGRMVESFGRVPLKQRFEDQEHYEFHNQIPRNSKGPGIGAWWLARFYRSFLASAQEEVPGEDPSDDAPFPAGHVPMMTIHQSKGLEFPIVMVGDLVPRSNHLEPSGELLFHQLLRPFAAKTPIQDLEAQLVQDSVRLFYVAFTRAEDILMRFSYEQQKRHSHGHGFGHRGAKWLEGRASVKVES